MIVSLSGGKDSVAMLLHLVQRYGTSQIVAHYQVLPEDWPGTLDYNQRLCARLGVPLVAQQMLYEPVGDGTAVRRLAIRDIHQESDVVPCGTPGVIAGVTDLAFRRRWPPSAASRFCTRYFKSGLLDYWLRQQRDRLSEQNHESALPGELASVALGERAGESPRRARKEAITDRLAWATGECITNWLPIHQWSRRQVFRCLRDHSVEPHPAYREQGLTDRQMYDVDTEGGPRTSCRFCIFATHSDVCHQAQLVANLTLLQRLRAFEQTTGRTWWPQRSATALSPTTLPLLRED
jgi:3'-phosphoadenosine 5'-phosphosulfate sulfotransferase (PAPS reductase)/FAD synthetase